MGTSRKWQSPSASRTVMSVSLNVSKLGSDIIRVVSPIYLLDSFRRSQM